MKIKIHPLFIITAPVAVLVSYAQYGAQGDPVEHPSRIQRSADPPAASAPTGRALFLKNCAHCHGAEAHGDDGPDLHALGWTEEQIANRIRHGKSGQMTAFAGKLPPSDINLLVAYVRDLK
jgi:mono/diheme cytochrome c family protein